MAGGHALTLLVVVEVALAMVLLTSAGLMARNVVRLLTTDVGYDPASLTRVNLGLSAAPYADAARRTSTIRRILEGVEAVPGVAAAGVTSLQPIPRTRSNLGTQLQPDTTTDVSAPLPVVNRRLVTPGYFRTMGVRVLRGRTFEERDGATGAPVVVVNEAAARRFWPGTNPVGRRVRPSAREESTTPWHTVIGVVSDMAEPDTEAMPESVYQSYAQANGTLPPGVWVTTSVSLMVRSTGAAQVVLDAVRRAIREVDPALPVFEMADMEATVAEPLSDQRVGAIVFVGFGVFGLLMAVLGTYGMLAFSVSRRMPEFGLRLALGATRSALWRSVLFQGLQRVGVGLVLGTLLSLGLSQAMGSVLTEVSPRDPATFGVVAVTLLAAGALASWLPAWRATRVDPVTALKAE